MFSHPADITGHSKSLQVKPHWIDVAVASSALPMGERDLLHAGPPISSPEAACQPIVNSAISAILFEGWASSSQEAQSMFFNGQVQLKPAQDHGCVVPLADVLSPSMWVQHVRDLTGIGQDRFSPLNSGVIHPQRLGVFSPEVVEQLRWLHTRLGPTLKRALGDLGGDGIDLLASADAGLMRGDDLHANNTHASMLLAQQLERFVDNSHGHDVKTFLRNAPPFFLNLWMAACSCMLSAARGLSDCGIVTAAGGNGYEFGIQTAQTGSQWWVTRATPPVPIAPVVEGTPLPAIGDSAIVDLAGFGAMAHTTAAPRDVPFATLWPHLKDLPSRLLGAVHVGMPLTLPRFATSVRQIQAQSCAPVIALGILDAQGQRGRLGGGFFTSPQIVFDQSAQGLPL